MQNIDTKLEPEIPEKTYTVSFVASAATYDKNRGKYLPLTSPNMKLTWEQLCNVLLKKDVKADKDGYGLVPSSFKISDHPKAKIWNFWRLKSAALETSVLALDVEEFNVGSDDAGGVESWLQSILPNTSALIYTTFSHGCEGKGAVGFPRLRVVIPLSRPVCSQTEYQHLFAWAVERFGGALDSGAKDPSRILYTYRGENPAATKERWFCQVGGSELDVDALPTSQATIALAELADAAQAEIEAQNAKREQDRAERLKAIESGALIAPSKKSVANYVKATIEGMTRDIVNAAQGDRHAALAKVSSKAGSMVDAEYFPEYLITSALIDAGVTAVGESRRAEVERTVRDQIAYGQSNMTPFDWSTIATYNPKKLPPIDWSRVDFSQPISFAIVDGFLVQGGRND